MTLRRFLLLVARDTTVWIAIAIVQALSADEEREAAEDEAEMLEDLEARMREREWN